ncbi:hypothetical protein [Streptomyces diastatochromogenes]|uniref:hypothetical protein n=1 Tax=Streptomyces diastatochromogenes TaxID=42236 RepID=UPI00369158C5
MSSTRSSARLIRLLSSVALLALGTTVLTSCDDHPGPAKAQAREARGTALDGGMQSEAEISFEHAQVGAEYWVSLPQTGNRSAKPLTLLDAEITQVPAGVKVLEYKAVSGNDTEGHAMGVSLTGADAGEIERARDRAGRPVRVKAHRVSDVYYLARVRVTGTVHGNLDDCRFRYRQGSTEYSQDLPCLTRIRLGAPLKLRD